MPENNIENINDKFELNRFIEAQEPLYPTVLKELKNGIKLSHWMWFIFPQVFGLGQSKTTQFYAIKSKEEAIAYLNHPLLGERLRECAALLLSHEDKTASQIFGSPDSFKLQSSMSLFASVAGDEKLFQIILDKFYENNSDERTNKIILSFPAVTKRVRKTIPLKRSFGNPPIED